MTDRNLTTKRYSQVQMTREGMYLYLPPSDLVEVGGIPGVIDPFAESSGQQFPLGTKLVYAEREFRYAKMGATVGVAGNLYQSVVPLAGRIDEAIGTPAVGDTTIDFTPNTVTTDDMAADEFADGYLWINDETGEGEMYRIKSHPAITGGVSGVITLYDPIRVAPAAAATATIVHNRWRNVIIHPSPPTALLAGWTVKAVTANYYCWLQTRGPVAALTQGTLIIGDLCAPSATVNGAVMPSAALETDGPIVGQVMAVNADTEYAGVWASLP